MARRSRGWIGGLSASRQKRTKAAMKWSCSGSTPLGTKAFTSKERTSM